MLTLETLINYLEIPQDKIGYTYQTKQKISESSNINIYTKYINNNDNDT